ncbi:MAG: hypothetical protein LBU77_00040 [Clostridiales bacterium]|jgi:excinuclease UvrABC ATPase subunit|nr:hypothetical protein [Clostridiales bacterium]
MIVDLKKWKESHGCEHCLYEGEHYNCTNANYLCKGLTVAQMLKMSVGGKCPYFKRKKQLEAMK